MTCMELAYRQAPFSTASPSGLDASFVMAILRLELWHGSVNQGKYYAGVYTTLTLTGFCNGFNSLKIRVKTLSTIA